MGRWENLSADEKQVWLKLASQLPPLPPLPPPMPPIANSLSAHTPARGFPSRPFQHHQPLALNFRRNAPCHSAKRSLTSARDASDCFSTRPLTIHWTAFWSHWAFWPGFGQPVAEPNFPASLPKGFSTLARGSLSGALSVAVFSMSSPTGAKSLRTTCVEIFMVQHGGLVFYGGLIGATIAGMLYLHFQKTPSVESR